MYHPIELTKKIEETVVHGTSKKYYRFRPTGFYGGIATADTVGCNLRCKFCWSAASVWDALHTGEFYSSEDVAAKLHRIAENKGYSQIRISGGEPTVGKQHLIALLNAINKRCTFILETNGILLGYDRHYVEELSVFDNLHVRVCLKGTDAEEFTLFTGANQGFDHQINALCHLRDARVSFNIALVSVHPEKKKSLFQKLQAMNLGQVMVEEEEITLYPMVKARLQKEHLLHYFQ
ncbi:MAG TPA: radical SAM protein [Candidatus Thermoplasmatota archaeon]|nr:radical SAM protein [Candidatus Thermoplasmatota archaeon]